MGNSSRTNCELILDPNWGLNGISVSYKGRNVFLLDSYLEKILSLDSPSRRKVGGCNIVYAASMAYLGGVLGLYKRNGNTFLRTFEEKDLHEKIEYIKRLCSKGAKI